MKYCKFLLVYSAFFLLTGCAISPRQALPVNNRSSVQSTQVFLNTDQNQICSKSNDWFNSDIYDPYNPMPSGAIVRSNEGAEPQGIGPAGYMVSGIIQGAEIHSGQTAITPIANALGGFNFMSYFQSALSSKLTGIPWLHVQQNTLQYNARNNEQAIVNAAKQNAVLFVGTTYALNSNFNQLEVAAYVKLDVKQASPQMIYANNFYYIYRLNSGKGDTTTNKNAWMQNNAALLKAKLQDAANLISKMVAMDINNPNINAYANSNTVVKIRAITGLIASGRVIEKQGPYSIIYLQASPNKSGEMYAVNANGIIQ